MTEKVAISLLMESKINTSTECLSASELDWNNNSLSIGNTSSSSEENDYLLLFPL